MIAAWMLYAIIVSGIVALASRLVERAVRALGRPARFIWLGALAASLALSARPLLITRDQPTTPRTPQRGDASATSHARDGSSLPSVPASRMLALRALDALAIPRWFSAFDTPLLALWFAGSALWTMVLLASAVRLRRQRMAWRRATIDGVAVHVSEHVGPALFGLARHDIVIPSWALELDPSRQRMILAHEMEHAHAADPLSLLLGASAVLLLPWNPMVWLMYHRLRFVVEADCDARVLARSTDVRAYGELLLDVGARTASGLAPIAALTEGHSILERRISLMTQPPAARPRLLSTAVLAVAAALAFAACKVPRPAAAPTPAPATAAAAAPNAERVLVKLTSLGLEGTDPTPTVLVFADGPARVGIGTAMPTALSDTLRLSSLPAMTMDVTEGDVHLRLMGPGSMSIGADVTNGRALKFTATGAEIIVLKGGIGVQAGPRGIHRSGN